MMLSPETYYEVHLKGKSPEQIMTCIRSLKRTIGQCKKKFERYYAEDIEEAPGTEVILRCSRLYLEKAKEALAETGGTYSPSKKEVAEQALKADLKHIQKLVFIVGGFFGGSDEITVLPNENDTFFVRHIPSIDDRPDFEFPYDRNEFYEMINDIHLEEWKHRYYDPFICDGTQWELKISFDNGRRPATWYGSNAFPPDYELLEGFFHCVDASCLEDVEEDEEDENEKK